MLVDGGRYYYVTLIITVISLPLILAQIASYNIKLGRTLKIDRVIEDIASSTSSASTIDQDEKRILFYIIGGLIKEAKGAAIVLNMISHLIAKHDDSMSLSFHFNKADKFGSSTGKYYCHCHCLHSNCYPK